MTGPCVGHQTFRKTTRSSHQSCSIFIPTRFLLVIKQVCVECAGCVRVCLFVGAASCVVDCCSVMDNILFFPPLNVWTETC